MSFSHGLQDGFRCSVARPAVYIYNGDPIPGKVLAETFLDHCDRGSDGVGVIVRRDSDKQIHLSDTHELA